MRGKLKFFAGVAIGIGIGAATDNLGIGIGVNVQPYNKGLLQLSEIWDDASTATGGNHKFELHCDHERPHIIRAIDLQYQAEEEQKPEILPNTIPIYK